MNGGGGVVWRAEHSQSQMEFRGLTILFIIVIMIIVITLESTYLFEPFPGVVASSLSSSSVVHHYSTYVDSRVSS